MNSGATRLRASTLLLAAALGGCSALEVSDVFVARETGEKSAVITGTDAIVSVDFDADTRFYSAGVLGIPVIPTYAKGAAKVLNMEIRLRLSRRHDYSFAAAPCLTTATGPLCPELVSIAPAFDSGDVSLRDALGRPTGGRIAALSARSVEYSPAKLGTDGRVTSADIEKDCFYDGNPPWTSGEVNTIYTYRCAEACPMEFVVNADDIVVVGDTYRSRGSFHFKRIRATDYQGMTPVQ